MLLECEQQNNKPKTKICESTMVVDREKMWCRGSKGTGIDAADERAAHTTEPVQSDHRIVGMTLKKKK